MFIAKILKISKQITKKLLLHHLQITISASSLHLLLNNKFKEDKCIYIGARLLELTELNKSIKIAFYKFVVVVVIFCVILSEFYFRFKKKVVCFIPVGKFDWLEMLKYRPGRTLSSLFFLCVWLCTHTKTSIMLFANILVLIHSHSQHLFVLKWVKCWKACKKSHAVTKDLWRDSASIFCFFFFIPPFLSMVTLY